MAKNEDGNDKPKDANGNGSGQANGLAATIREEISSTLEAAEPAHDVLSPETVEAVKEILASADWLEIPDAVLLSDELSDIHSSREFIQLLRSKRVKVSRIKRAMKYEYELECLQGELVKLQRWVQEEGLRLAIIFEGRDAAGKGGTIRRFAEHLNPRAMRLRGNIPRYKQDLALRDIIQIVQKTY